MRNKDRTLLTLEERLGLAKKSQVASPETAAKLVQRFSELHPAHVFCGRMDVNSMNKLTGEFWDSPPVDIENYRGFCQSFRLAIENDNDFCRINSYQSIWDLRTGNSNLCQPIWGLRINNAMVLLGLMLLDNAKGIMKSKDIYYCMQMTLRQYLDALVDLSFQKSGKQDQSRAENFRIWRNILLEDYDGSKPLGEALTDILRRYIAAWQKFDHLDHIIRCMGALSCYLEQEEIWRTLPHEETDRILRFREALFQYDSELGEQELVELDKKYLNPKGYYFTIAFEYLWDIPDPGSKDIKPGTLRSQFFLSAHDYAPDTLRELAAKSPSSDLRELLEESISGEKLAHAMREINIAVTDLFALWVEPYLRIGEYHYEKHLK